MCIRKLGAFLLITAVMAALCGSLTAQDDKPVVAAAASSKFAALPVLPSCATVAVQRGDPSKGPSVLLLKATSGCVIPWHWHTASENIMMVSGTGKMAMKDSPAQTAHAGDYVFLPGKHVHEFTCVASCMMFDMPEGAFDIHYVDKSGTEIPVEQALKKPGKAPPKK